MISFNKNKTINNLFIYGLLCCFLLIPSALFAKQAFFNFTNVGIKQGLANTFVIKVLQDKQGFIWVGTQDGLFRYDGYDFIQYQHDPDDATSLAHNYVQTLFEDSTGILWVGTRGGVLHQYQATFDSFSRFPFDKDYPNTSRSHSTIMSIAQGDDNSLWVATFGGGLNKFDLSSKQFIQNVSHQPQDDNSLSDDRVYVVLQANNGLVWVGTRDGGLNAFNTVTGNFKRYQHHPDKPDSLSHNKVFALLEDSKGTLWVGTRGGGLNRFNPAEKSFTRFQHHPDKPHSLSSNQVYAIHQDNAGTLWVGTRGQGLNRFNPEAQRFSRYLQDPLNKKSLGNNSVRSITQDHTGNLWIATFGGGLSVFNPDSQRFGLNRHQPDNPNSLSQGGVLAIFKDKSGILWMGSTAGLDRYDEDKDKWLHYQAEPESDSYSGPKSDLESEPGHSQSISDSNVWAIFEDAFGVLWVGTRNGGLNRVKRFGESGEPLEPEDYSFVHYKKSLNNPHSLSDDYVLVIHEDRAKQLWVGTQNGLNRFNRAQNNFTRFTHDKAVADSLGDNIINSLFTDSQGRFWIGTQQGGLNLFVGDTVAENSHSEQSRQGFVRFKHQPDDDNSLSDNTIWSIAQDAKGILWLGTEGGLNRFNPETQKATHFRVKHGLASDRVYHVLIDKEDNAWIGDNGISILHPESDSQNNTFSITNHIGSEANCFANQGASFQAQDGRLYWGSNSQYCAFYPEQAIKSSRPPILAFTGFKLLNKSVLVSQQGNPSPLLQAINQSPAITLNHKQNILSFEFSTLHFDDPKANQYRYKLEGFNEDWIETDWKNRHATYTNLSAGNYTFTVKASNHEGLWNEQGKSIQLTILPPPWKTWWAYTLYGLFIISLILVFIRSQRQKVLFERELNAKLESKVIERTKELQSSNENLEEANTQLEELSLTDQLTGLRNRRFLVNNLQNDIALILRKHKKAKLTSSTESLKESDLIFFLIDLDHFKLVNDLHGHTAGDSVLIQIKSILERVFRETDHLVRWGGEEFLVIARFTDRVRAPELAERLRKAVEEHSFDIDHGNFLTKTCSIGYANYPFLIDKPDCLDWERVVDIADHCLYAAKKSSRNAWVGLENINCTEENLFSNITEKTQNIIDLDQLEVTSSIDDKSLLKWD